MTDTTEDITEDTTEEKNDYSFLESRGTRDIGNEWALPLMCQGVIVKLTIKQWSGVAKLEPEDLGLTNVDQSTFEFQKKYINLGSEKIVPPKYLRDIKCVVARAKNNLKDHSFQTIWGDFVPISAFLNWEEQNIEIKKDFKEAVCRLGDNYDSIIMDIRKDYRNMAIDVWHRLHPNKGNPTEAFIQEYVNKQVFKIPDVTDLIMNFDYKDSYFTISLPGIVEKQTTMMQEEIKKQELLEDKTEREIEAQRRIQEIFVEKRKEMMDSFLKDTVFSLRKHIGEICDEVLLSISKNENKINKKHQNKIMSMLEKIETLNFCHDTKIEDMLVDLRKDVIKPNNERVDENVIIKLTNISNKAKEYINPDFNENVEFMDI